MSVAERWARLASATEPELSLAEGALLIAAEEYPALDIDAYLGRIEDLAATLKRRLRSDIGTTEALLALNRYVYEELGFSGNSADYYDPRNSYLNDVIERRLGIPITLAVVYIEIGRHIGLALQGISFPSHFLVKCTLRDGTVVLDPFAGGVSLSLDDLEERLKPVAKGVPLDATVVASLLTPATPTDIFARMLRNLRAIHTSRGDRMKALAASNRLLSIAPGAAEEYRDRGELYVELECSRAALADFRQYLKLRPTASDSGRIASRIAELEPLAARLN